MKAVVISPHLDDGIFSLGATINRLGRSGVDVELVTVFAGDATGEHPPSLWDRTRGVPSAGLATTARRAEDTRAAAHVGATPVWLPYQDQAYIALRDPDQIWCDLAAVCKDADYVFVPGWPLDHPDHEYCTQLYLERRTDTAAVFVYAEWPYAQRPKSVIKAIVRRRTMPLIAHHLQGTVRWRRQRPDPVDVLARQRALEEYAFELARLRTTTARHNAVERLAGAETIGSVGDHRLPWERA